MRIVQQAIKALEEEFVDVPVNILKEHLAENHDMSEEKTDEILKTLKAKGLTYEPRNGLVRLLED